MNTPSRSPKVGIQRRHRGKKITTPEKHTIINMYGHLRENNKNQSRTRIAGAIEQSLGVSQKSVLKILAEERSGCTISSPRGREENNGRNPGKNKRTVKYDDFIQNAIRRIIHQFFLRNEPPTLNLILAAVNNDEDLPSFTRTTLWRFLKDLGFKYSVRGRNAIITEREDLLVWRRSYLREIKQHRNKGSPIIYLDETWINAGDVTKKAWEDKTVEGKTSKDCFLNGLSSGLKNPVGKGKRLIIVHAGNENGFINNTAKIWESKKGTIDYHDEMDAESFEFWFTNKLLPNIPTNSVIVMDNASYHSRMEEPLPTQKWKKGELQEWLRSKNITFQENMLKPELMSIAKRERDNYKKFAVDELAKKHNHCVLRLPPYHCELNPIEMVWSQAKAYVRQRNTTHQLPDVERLVHNAFAYIDRAGSWENHARHIIESVEPRFRKLDNIIDDVLDSTGSSNSVVSSVNGTSGNLIVNIGNDYSSSDASDCEFE